MAVVQKSSEGPWYDAPPVALYIDNLVLTAGAAKTITVPAGADLVLIGCSSPPFYLRQGGTLTAVPSGDVTDGSGSAVSPTYRRVDRGTTLKVISPNNCVMSFEWYKR